jgi:hypothetical protein
MIESVGRVASEGCLDVVVKSQGADFTQVLVHLHPVRKVPVVEELNEIVDQLHDVADEWPSRKWRKNFYGQG